MARPSSSPSRRRRPTSASAHPSAILPDGRLNVDLLQREVASDVANDARYRAEDGMKKRAVGSSKDYDEFRNLVLASQLKPVNRNEMSELFNPLSSVNGGKRGGVANKCFRGGDGNDRSNRATRSGRADGKLDGNGKGQTRGGDRLAESNSNRKGGDGGKSSAKRTTKGGGKKKKKSPSPNDAPPGKTPVQFEREWRARCTDPASTVQYLLATASASESEQQQRRLILRPEEAPRTIFRVEIDANMMGDIVAAMACVSRLPPPVVPPTEDGSSGERNAAEKIDEVLSSLAEISAGDDDKSSEDGSAMLRNRARFVYRWMDSMTKCGRFGLNVSFLSGMQKEDVRSVCAFLERHCCSDADVGGGSDGSPGIGRYVADDVMRLREAYLQER